jgi:DNA-binding NarL/FixJ family response regulator
VLVELVRRYSNRLDLRERLHQAGRQIQQEQEAPSGTTSVSGRPSGVWKVKDRLSPEDVEVMVQGFRAGTTQKVLAEQYGLNVSTVKAILRQRRPQAARTS